MASMTYSDKCAALEQYMRPVIRAAHKADPAMALVYEPGTDAPLGLPTEKMVYIPKGAIKEIEGLVPKETLDALRAEAAKLLREKGYPGIAAEPANADPDNAGIELDSAEAEPEAGGDTSRTNPAKPHKRWTGGRTAAGLVAATALASGHGQPASASSVEAIGVESQRPRTRREDERAGASLVEALVAVTIMATLAGLLAPAVQKVRESASEAAFKNNMKQVALGIKDYESAHGHYPYAVTYEKGQGGILVPHSWVVDVLPHLEQNNIGYNTSLPYDSPQNAALQNLTFPVLNHPSYPLEAGRMRIAALSSSGQAATQTVFDPNNPGALYIEGDPNSVNKDYVLYSEHPQDDFNVVMPPQWVMDTSGKWKQNSRTTDVPDGTSNTPMLGAHLHEDGNRDPFILGKTRITGLMFSPEVGGARVDGGLTGNVLNPDSDLPNYVQSHVQSHDGKRGRDRQRHTIARADGSVGVIRTTGDPLAFPRPADAELWREMVTKGDGTTPDLDR